MICRLLDWVARPRKVIRLGRPVGMTLRTGAAKEMIYAVYDKTNRMVHLVVHTKQKSLM